MLYDIAAIQHLYGANMSTRSGNTTYSWNSGEQILETIWDGGGEDTIDWSNQTSDANIDLNDGAWSELGPSYYNGQSYDSQTLAIAFGAVIENANGGSGHDTIYGNEISNTILGNKGNDYLNGRGGSDKLYGNTGNDTLYGGGHNDVLSGGSGSDRLYGNSGSDTLYGGGYNDVLSGGNGSDRLYGNSGSDKLYGGAHSDTLSGGNGSDRLYGNSGSDKLYGGAHSDTLSGGNGSDRLYGNSGSDKLYGGAHNDVLSGGNGSDRLYGGSGSDKLYGGAHNDVLSGGNGSDRLYGGSGNDKLYGGGGDDLFLFNDNNGSDRINGFQEGAGSFDQLDFSSHSQANSTADLSISQQSTNVLIEFGASESVLLIGVDSNQLHADDFIF